MATQQAELVLGFEADADLSTKQFFLVKLSTDGQVALCSVAGEKGLGVLQNKPSAAGHAAEVAYAGIVKAVAGATIAIGDKVTTDANGKLAVAASTNHVWGVCTVGAAANELAEVLIGQPQPVLA